MSLDLNTRIVTTTPYNIVNSDTVVFVNHVGPASIILPADGTTVLDLLQQANQEPQSVLPSSHINSGLDDPAGLRPEEEDHNNRRYRSFYIKDYSGNAAANPITITSAGGKTIDSGSFAIINAGYGHIQVVYDGTNWKIIS
jgi:hypothetical protein